MKKVTDIFLYLWQLEHCFKRTPQRITKRIQHMNRHMINDCKKHAIIIYTVRPIIKQKAVVFK